MTELTLYHMPRACSFVTMNALAEAGIEYNLVAVDIFKGQQKADEYLKLNPSGKVPTLVVNGAPLTENAAILIYLDTLFPDANLIPGKAGSFEQAKARSDLVWCSSTLHPAVRMVRMPIRFTDGDPSGVQAKGHALVSDLLGTVEARLAEQPWMRGSDWSIVDVYLYWCTGIALSAGFSFDAYPSILEHRARVEARPSFQTAFQRQEELTKEAGIVFPA